MDELLTPLVDDCPRLLFSGKFADLEALSRGEPDRVRPVIERATRDWIKARPAPGREVVIVLGGNGFVGSHLVARLSRQPEIRRVYAMVRATDAKSPWLRLEDAWSDYRIEDVDRGRIEVLRGSPTKPMLGLTREHYLRLADEVDQVFNCASTTDYGVRYLQVRTNWVLGLLRVVDFCLTGCSKHLNYLGSVGAYFYSTPADFRRPDSWWYSGYCQMKWLNGQLLGWLARDGSMSVTLVVAPYILGSTKVGIDPAQHYSWWRIVEAARSIGCIWKGPGMNFCPVDVLVDALTVNAVRPKPLEEMLPCNPEPYDNALLAELLDLDLVPYADFDARARQLLPEKLMSTILSTDFSELVRITNRSALMPDEVDPSWCDHRRLFGMYLENVDFRDVRRSASVAAVDS